MPTYTPHSLLTFGGNLRPGADAETWQCGVRIAQKHLDGTFEPLADLLAYVNAIFGGLQTWWHSGTASTGASRSDATLNWLKVANIGANGKYSGVVDASGNINPQLKALTGTTAGDVAAVYPPMLGAAISFHTAQPGKWAVRGRIYPPVALASQSGASYMSTTEQTNLMNWGKLLLTNISKPAPLGGNGTAIRPVIASGHAGEIAEINEVRVGSTLDVQRRRKGSIKETYVKSAWS